MLPLKRIYLHATNRNETHRTSMSKGGGALPQYLKINEKQKDPGFGPQPEKKMSETVWSLF